MMQMTLNRNMCSTGSKLPGYQFEKSCGIVGSGESALTLVETLVVTGILAVLVALLFPVAQGGIHNSRVAQSISRMKNLGTAIQLYGADNDMRFPGSGYGTSTRWFHQVVPYLGIEPNGVREGVPFYSQAYFLYDLVSCPVLHGQPIKGGSDTYLARFGLNRRLEGDDAEMRGFPMLRVKQPARTVLLATKASGAPGLRDRPYPDSKDGVAGNYERGRSVESSVGADGFIGSHAYAFCDGHIEKHVRFIGADAFKPEPD